MLAEGAIIIPQEAVSTALAAAPPDTAAVYIWHIPVMSEAATAPWFSALSPEEQAYAASFRHEGARRSFVVGRGVMRTVLGGYCGCAPAALVLEIGRYGKPRLAVRHSRMAQRPGGLHFSLSHAGAHVLFAVADGEAIGLDLEVLAARPGLDEANCRTLAQQYFTAAENARWLSLPQAARWPLFLTLWTRKEAYAKAGGLGLMLPFGSIDTLTAQPTVAAPTHPFGARVPWRLLSWSPHPDCVATLACSVRVSDIRVYVGRLAGPEGLAVYAQDDNPIHTSNAADSPRCVE